MLNWTSSLLSLAYEAQDTLLMLLRVYKRIPQRLTSELTVCGGLQPMLSILDRQSEPVRVAGVKVT